MKGQKALAEHEQVYHAAMPCQAASLPLTGHGLRGEKKVCPAKGKKKSKGSLFVDNVSLAKGWIFQSRIPSSMWFRDTLYP